MPHQLKKKRDRKRSEKALIKSKQTETSDETTYILMSDADDKEDQSTAFQSPQLSQFQSPPHSKCRVQKTDQFSDKERFSRAITTVYIDHAEISKTRAELCSCFELEKFILQG